MTARLAILLVLLAGTAFGQNAKPRPAQTPAASNSAAASGPSLDDTIAFMKQALDSYGDVEERVHSLLDGSSGTIVFVTTLESSTGCQLVLGVQLFVRQKGVTETLDLSTLDPSSIKVSENVPSSNGQNQYDGGGWALSFQTTNLAKSIVIRNEISHVTDSADHDHFYIADRDVADRFAKAMSHVIELCGGKKSAF